MSLLGTSLSGCSDTLPIHPAARRIALPTFTGCAAAVPGRDAFGFSAPVKVVRPAGLGTVVTAAVCIDGRGPFTFVVDTGSSVSVIDTSVATELHLALSGTFPNDTFGCSRTLSVTAPASLSVGGLRLDRQIMSVGTVRSPLLPGLDGLIGSDILSRFGAVRFDFAAQRLMLRLPEGAEPERSVTGDGKASPGDGLAAGTTATIAAHVEVAGGAIPAFPRLRLASVQVDVPVSLGDQAAQPWIVDTGASDSLASTAVARAGGLALGGRTMQGYGGLDCPLTITGSSVSSWRLAGTALAPQAIQVMPLPGGEAGLLGAATLARYGPLVVDYASGDILLDLPHHG